MPREQVRKKIDLLPLFSGSEPRIPQKERLQTRSKIKPRKSKGKVSRLIGTPKRNTGKARILPKVQASDPPIPDAGPPRRLREATGSDMALLKMPRIGAPPLETIGKRGRPRIGEVAVKPWEALGMSERTYYRRQKEIKK
jgi:hypothetical protein